MHSFVFWGVLDLAQKLFFPRTAKALMVFAAIDISASAKAELVERKDK